MFVCTMNVLYVVYVASVWLRAIARARARLSARRSLCPRGAVYTLGFPGRQYQLAGNWSTVYTLAAPLHTHTAQSLFTATRSTVRVHA